MWINILYCKSPLKSVSGEQLTVDSRLI